ncbi:hypothetical protein BJ322DRAFT_1208222 [Thelephora terrestris]|uniref:F-box domain-containing protein n=1 Tax=Thelephora terrestris TaxID=56493 RepID=A0A9P6HMR0_9AGAM|nr:hypothetical protein BJ322DRAFT_1208222 [Thelephora terrestris]
MDEHTYPGRGLSLSQLVFALNEELKRVAYSPIFTLEAVSQLDQDASIASAAIREWKNSFARINRIPTDILSLIPTYLSSQKDRFHAASVCRHWRRVLLERGELWSQLFLIKGEDYVSTLLERAKGCALEIIADRDAPVGTIALISTCAQQIRDLEFVQNHLQDIETFSEFNSGRLPLLRSLKIEAFNFHSVPIPPSLAFFRGSINLERFVFYYHGLPFLSHFVFPNLTTFELSSRPEEEWSGLYLLDFLGASPTLRTVKMDVSAQIVLEGVPQEMVVVLPNVETFSLNLVNGIVRYSYGIATHISCPRSRDTSLTHETYDEDMGANPEVFPTPAVWNTIVRQYMASPIEKVTLNLQRPECVDDECLLTFRSSDETIVRLGFKVYTTDGDEDGSNIPRATIGREILCQALTAIRRHPLLSHVKRLHINCRAAMWHIFRVVRMSNEVPELFDSLGPLDELILDGCDSRVFFPTFVDIDSLEKPHVLPQIKDLTILHPLVGIPVMEWMNGIVELAKAHYARGMPFECVTVRMWRLPIEMAEELRPWVGVVDCRED